MITDIARQNFSTLLSAEFSLFWMFVVIGLVATACLEHQTIRGIVKHKVKLECANPDFHRLMVRLMHVVGGSLLAMSAYAITAFLYGRLTSELNINLLQDSPVNNEVDFLRVLVSNGGNFTVSLLLWSASALAASAGTRWLVNTAKLLATLAALSPFVLLTIAIILGAA